MCSCLNFSLKNVKAVCVSGVECLEEISNCFHEESWCVVTGHVIEPWLKHCLLEIKCVVCGCFQCMTKISMHLLTYSNILLTLERHTPFLIFHLHFGFQGPGSFLASPIRDSPGPPSGPGPHDPLLPPGPPGRLPPPGLYRPPRPGLYHLPPGPHGPPPNAPPPLHGPLLPANGHPGMPLPGPMGGEFGPRPANGHTFLPRPGPGPMIDPRGPLQPHFRPPLPHNLGPMPPPSGTVFLRYSLILSTVKYWSIVRLWTGFVLIFTVGFYHFYKTSLYYEMFVSLSLYVVSNIFFFICLVQVSVDLLDHAHLFLLI